MTPQFRLLPGMKKYIIHVTQGRERSMERKKSLDRSKSVQRYDAILRSNACLLFFTLDDLSNTLSCFHTQDGQWSRKKSRKVIFIISTITIDLQSHGDENDKQFSPGPTPGREHQHTFNKTSNSISSMIWISPTAITR